MKDCLPPSVPVHGIKRVGQWKQWGGQQLPGVYALRKAGVIIYIGQSHNILRRISAHSFMHDFDDVLFIRNQQHMPRLYDETALIRHYRPKLNIAKKSPPGIWKNFKLSKKLSTALERHAEKENLDTSTVVALALTTYLGPLPTQEAA